MTYQTCHIMTTMLTHWVTLSHNDYYAYTLGHIVTPLHKATRLEMVFLCPAWDTSAIMH